MASGDGTAHLHAAWYGYTSCVDPACTLPRADPDGDAHCVDPDCEGGCEAARSNAARRQHLYPNVLN